MDLTMEPGVDFVEQINDAVWIEIEAGLRQEEVRVVPVLVQGATMPSAEELPASTPRSMRGRSCFDAPP
jgi:hypothetical protein